MEGFAVRPAVGTYVTVEPVSSLAISGAFDEDTAREAQATFEQFMQANGIPQAADGAGRDVLGMAAQRSR